MRVDKAFDSWLDENRLFYDRYGLAQLYHALAVCVCVCVCVCASVCVRVKEERETGKEREESELVLPVLIPASQLVLCWPEPRLLQPDD